MNWLQVPLSDIERAQIGAPPGSEKFTAVAPDGGTLVAFRVNAGGWQLNVAYLPKPTDTEGDAGVASNRPPTYAELMSARWALLPPDGMFILPFFPESHPEAKLTERANLVLIQMVAGPAQRPSGIIIPN